jgi:hypothetical protein
MTTKQIVDLYAAAWNEPDVEKRRQLLAQAWTDDGVYCDPMSLAEGRDALLDLIAQFQQQMPGARIAMASGVDEHHGRLRFAWKLVAADGTTRMEGIDIGELAPDGRLRSITGFFGPPPA